MRSRGLVPLLLGLSAGVSAGAVGAERGEFVRTCWVGRRFRVNSPDTLKGRFRHRQEAKAKGRVVIRTDEQLPHVSRAEFSLELWGGHPGTARKRFALNGKSTYPVPEVGTAENNCTYSYPVIPLRLAELANGENVFRFTCEKGKSFWGHYIIDNACLRLVLRDGHPDLKKAGLAGFAAAVAAARGPIETIDLSLKCAPASREAIGSVEYWGRYSGYDENGDGESTDWHGFTKDRKTVGMSILGVATRPPFTVSWDLSMVPDQKEMAVCAVVRFKGRQDLVYQTAAIAGLATPERDAKVTLHYAKSLPRPFWSRAKRTKQCIILLDTDPERIARAELHVTIWDGGRGKTPHPFILNGHPLPVAGRGRHDLIYRKLEVPPGILKKGPNAIRLLSDTAHHGIEVCLPGPALVVRTEKKSE